MSRVRDSCGVCFGGSWRGEPNFMVAAPCGEILETLTKQIFKLFFHCLCFYNHQSGLSASLAEDTVELLDASRKIISLCSF